MPHRVSCTLLIVDDSEEDRQIFIEHIRRAQGEVNYRIHEASSVREGLALCDELAVDCIMVDYRMPDASGIDFLTRLHEKHERGHIGVVFVTGMGNENIAVSAMRAGAVDYISKVRLNSEALMRALENARRVGETTRRLAQAEHARMLAQSEQLRSEGDLQRLIESIRDYAIITLDVTGRVARWGAGARRLLGYHDHEAVGLRFEDMLQRGDRGALISQGELERAQQGPVRCDGRWFVRRDGGLFWGASLLSPIDNDLGDVCGFALVVHDISAWRDITQCFRTVISEREFLSQRVVDDLRAPAQAMRASIRAVRQQQASRPADASHDTYAGLEASLVGLEAALARYKQAEEHATTARASGGQVSLGEVLKHYTAINASTNKTPVAIAGDANQLSGPWDAPMLLQAFENIFAHARQNDPDVSIEVRPHRQDKEVAVGITFRGRDVRRTPMFLPYTHDPSQDGGEDLRLSVARLIIESLGGRVGQRQLHDDSIGLDIYLPASEFAHA